MLERVNRVTGVSRDRGDMDDLVRQLQAQSDAHDQLIGKIRAEEAATAALTREQENQARVTRFLAGAASGKSARDSAAVFQAADAEAVRRFEESVRQAATAENEMSAAAARLRERIDPLAAIQNKLNRELAEANALYKAGKISATELAHAEKLLADNAKRATDALNANNGIDSKGRPSLFGLKPYELQNLSFQINDVVTQIASGTSVTQTLAQQGGQLIQIFPRVGSAIAAALGSGPPIAIVASIGALLAGLREVLQEADRLREFGGVLAASADGAKVQAQALSDAADALDDYGLKAAEAVAITRTLLKEGINPDRFVEFGRAARDLADVLGIDVKDAAEQVADAFTGGYQAVKKLDDAANFLTAAEREHIGTLFETGRAQQARTEAFDIFARKQEDAAQKMRGPWSEAWRSLGNAAESFFQFIGNLGLVTGLANALDGLADSVTNLFNRLNGVRDIAAVRSEIATVTRQLAVGDRNSSFHEERTRHLLKLQRELEALKATAAGRTAADTRASGTEREAKATQDLTARTNELRAASKQLGDAERLRAAESAARREAENEIAERGLEFATEASQKAFIQAKAEDARLRVQEQITQEQRRQVAEAERLAKLTRFQNPVDGPITSGFGARRSPGGVGSTFHQGLDFGVPIGTSVKAPAIGVVEAIGFDPKLGKYVVIDHGNNVRSKFGHLSDNSIRNVGDTVLAGDLIGKSGNTGSATTGAHLHYTVTVNGKAVDPTKGLFPQDGKGLFQIDGGDAGNEFAKTLADRNEKQKAFNDNIEEENKKRQRSIDSLEAQQGLIGEVLIAEERRQAIADAVLAKEQEIKRINADLLAKHQQEIQFTDAQRAAVERLTGAQFDLAHAKEIAAAQREAVEQPVDDITQQREELQSQIDFLRENGQGGFAAALLPQLDALNLKLGEAVEKARQFWIEVAAGQHGGPAAYGLTVDGVQAVIDKYETLKVQTDAVRLGTISIGGAIVDLKQVANQFAAGAANAFDRFAQGVAQGKNVFSSLRDAFLQFAADFLRQIADMIAKQIIFNIVASALSGGFDGGSTGTNGTGAIGGLQAHDGGIIGGDGPVPRAVRPEWFAKGLRYHDGGIAGLRPNEVATILERGEEVLTHDDPRHVLNGGGGGEANIKIVNTIDPGEAVSQGLGTEVGQKAVLNVIRMNSRAVKAALG